MSWEVASPLQMHLKILQMLWEFPSDALLNDETVSIKDKELLKKFEVIIQEMNEEDKLW